MKDQCFSSDFKIAAVPEIILALCGKKNTDNHFKTGTFYGVKLIVIRRCSTDFSSISWLEILKYCPDLQLGMHLTMEKHVEVQL